MESFIKSLTFDFLGQEKHKVSYDNFLGKENSVLLDVRTNEEFESVYFPMKHQVSLVIHIPLNELPNRIEEIPADKVVGVLCVSDVRSAIAYAYLQSKGLRNVRVLAGGTAGLFEELKTGKLSKQIKAVSE